jgi:hypothetical protein
MFPRLNVWMERYEIELVRIRAEKPDRFLWPDDQLQNVVDLMRQGFTKGKGWFNKDSDTIRATCKHFGIPCTYTHIDKFIRREK